MVYQEQIMKIAQDMGGYSLGQADLLRRAMGKKKKDEMEKHRSIFVDGATKNGISEKISAPLFEQMVMFAEYCLSYDMAIATVEYGAIPIGRIVEEQIACTVYSVDVLGRIYQQPVVQWHDRGRQELFEYALDNGELIRATADHKFMITTGALVAIDTIWRQGLELHRAQLPSRKLLQTPARTLVLR
jgi:DNA polymerase III subunit alpha